MTFKETLIACSSGELPLVTHTKFGRGQVTVVKSHADGGSYRGVAVRFPLFNFDKWFHDSNETDKRSNYLRELEIVKI